MSEQRYENYWKLTLAYTDMHSAKFKDTLQAIVIFINRNDTSVYTSDIYKSLQEKVSLANTLKDASLRKSINQFVKLGFINSQLISYNPETIEFLSAKTKKKRESLFSKIVYKYASLSSSISEYSSQREINFLLKTLEEIGSLSKVNIVGLMNVNILEFEKGYLNLEELNYHSKMADESGFIERKYNQAQYFFNLLEKLDDLVFIDDTLYFTDDAKVILGEDLKPKSTKRDGYLHRVYKNQLIEESYDYFNPKTKCMVEKLSYPSLVASHIKPFIDSDENEAYDVNNGLLLSRNMDILFDQGYISFDDSGKIVYALELEEDVKEHLKGYRLESVFINQSRLQYLDYHRKNILKKVA